MPALPRCQDVVLLLTFLKELILPSPRGEGHCHIHTTKPLQHLLEAKNGILFSFPPPGRLPASPCLADPSNPFSCPQHCTWIYARPWNSTLFSAHQLLEGKNTGCLCLTLGNNSPLTHSSIQSFIHSLTHSSIHLAIHSFTWMGFSGTSSCPGHEKEQ